MKDDIKNEQFANPPAQSEEAENETLKEIEASQEVTIETLQAEQEEEFKNLKQG